MTPYIAPGIIIQIDPMQIPELCGAKINNTSRESEIVIPRQIAMSLMYVFSTYSLGIVSKPFSKDHATVLHAIKRINEGLFTNDSLIVPTLTKVFNKLYYTHLHMKQLINVSNTKEVIVSNEVERRLNYYDFSKELIRRWHNYDKTSTDNDAVA